MSTRRFLTCALASCFAVQMCAAVANAEAGGAIGGGGSEVSSWVVGQGPGGGVTAPSGTTCGPWDHAANLSEEAGPPDVGTVRQDEAGVIWNLYYRNCEGTVQYIWVPMLTPADLGQLAFDQVLKNLPKPLPVLSPDLAVGGYVNFETWLSVTDPGVITATSSIPGLSATATALVVRIEWRPGDGSLVTCEPFGALPPTPEFTGPAPCGHTFTRPSHPKVTGTTDDRYHGSVTLVWAASWTASNGASGDLGEASSTVPFVYRVREIQTIGAEG
jgi:hypothetical protein